MKSRHRHDETPASAALVNGKPLTDAAVPADVLERITDAVFALDADWRFTYLNSAAERLLERPREELLGAVVWDEFPEAVGTIFQEQYEQARQTGEMRGFVSYYPPLARLFAVRAFPSDARDALTVYFQDITAQRASERRQRLLYDMLPQGVIFQDASGRITAANPAAQRILGLSLDELTGRYSADPRWSAVHEDGAPWPGETHPSMETLRTGQPVRDAVMGILHPGDNTYRWIRVNTQPLTELDPEFGPEAIREVLATFEDITERKRAEEERERLLDAERAARQTAQTAEDRLRTVLDVLPVGVVITDARGAVTLLNDAFYKLWGQAAPKVDGIEQYREYKGWWAATGEPIAAEDWAAARALTRGETSHGEEVTIETFDGERKTVLNSAAPIRDVTGAITGGVVVEMDITARKQMEEALQASQERLRLALEAAASGVFIWHVEEDRTEGDAGMIALFGVHSQEEITLAAALMELLHPDDRERYAKAVARAIDPHGPGILREDIRVAQPDGSLRWISITAKTVFEGDPPRALRLAGTAVDISDRKLAEEALRESEEKFRLLADNMSQLAWMANERGERFWYNRRWYEYTGASPDEMLGLGWSRIHHHDHLARVTAHVEAARKTGMAWEDTWPLRGADGEYRWFLTRVVPIRDANGEVTRWFGTNTDIHDQRLLEQQVIEANTALRAAVELAEERARELAVILDTMGDAVALVGPEGELLRANPAFDRLSDAFVPESERAAYLNATLAERGAMARLTKIAGNRLSPEDWPATRVLRGESFTGSHAQEVRLMGLAGREVVVSVSGVPLTDDEGRPAGGVLVLRDITERYDQEQERAQMLHVVAHELRSPLTTLKATVQINQRRARRGVQLRAEQLEPEARAVERMERMVNDLLDAARAETAHLELQLAPTDLTALCEQVATEQIAASGRGITLDLPATPLLAEVDGERIAQVVSNLLSNALKYSPIEATVTLHLRAEDDEAVIAVRDTGPGIPEEAQPRLFERFYRAPGAQVLHGSGVGLGVGLYLCKQFVERHGGAIAVKSAVGHGATFTIRLPLTHATTSGK